MVFLNCMFWKLSIDGKNNILKVDGLKPHRYRLNNLDSKFCEILENDSSGRPVVNRKSDDHGPV